jgi:hypothetical protein
MSAARLLGLVAAGALGVVCVGSAGIVALAGTEARTGPDTGTSATAAGLPPAMAALYRQAAGACPGLSWTILAAIGTVESSNGTSDLPGVRAGANSAGAEDIWTWDQGPWHVRDEGRWPRACGVSAVCEARRASGGRHTAFVACGADAWRVSGVAGGVAE